MLCRSTSTGILSSLLPAVSQVQTGFSDIERSSTPVTTPRYSHLQSPASQYFKNDGGDLDFDGASGVVQLRMPKFRKAQSENDLQSLWRSSSASAATLAAADFFHHDQDMEIVGKLDRLASARESAILEMSETSDTPVCSEIAEEASEVTCMVSNGNLWSERSGRMERQPASSSQGFSQGTSMHSAGHQEALSMSRGAATLDAPRGRVVERNSYSSQDEMRGPLPMTDIGLGGGNGGGGRKVTSGGGGNGGGNGDSSGVEAQYKRMLESDPGNPLFLRNYARFLHEVKRDPIKAEPYYERAILANPGDGELLGQYAQLIWEVYKDEERAGVYFDQAMQACPDDCYLGAAYASFLWSSEGNDDEELDSVAPAHSGSGYINNIPPTYGATAISA